MHDAPRLMAVVAVAATLTLPLRAPAARETNVTRYAALAGEVCGGDAASAERFDQPQAPGHRAARIGLGVKRPAITPVHLPSGAPVPAGLLPGLLIVPQGWPQGGGMVVLTWDGLAPFSKRDGLLLSGLLDACFAVLQLDLATPRGFAVDSNRTPPEPTVEGLAADLLAAAAALRRDHGAGTVVALGHGQGGEAALLAAARGALSAGARLGPRGRLATAGEPDRPESRAAAALLCAAIAATAPDDWPADACAGAGAHHRKSAVVP